MASFEVDVTRDLRPHGVVCGKAVGLWGLRCHVAWGCMNTNAGAQHQKDGGQASTRKGDRRTTVASLCRRTHVLVLSESNVDAFPAGERLSIATQRPVLGSESCRLTR